MKKGKVDSDVWGVLFEVERVLNDPTPKDYTPEERQIHAAAAAVREVLTIRQQRADASG